MDNGAHSLKRVSVIIPTYNRAELLKQTVDSVLAQTYSNIELIVVDDGSTDETQWVMEAYAGRLIYHRQDNQGAERAANLGYEMSSGDYISFFDHDDLMFPQKIARQVDILDRDPGVDICHCAYHYINADNGWLEKYHLLPKKEILRELIITDFIWSGGPLIRRKCLEECGLHDETLWTSDWDMWLRFSLQGYTFECIQEPLGAYRIMSNSQSTNVKMMEEGNLATIQKTFSHTRFPPNLCYIKGETTGRGLLQVCCWYLMNGDGENARRTLSAALDAFPDFRINRT